MTNPRSKTRLGWRWILIVSLLVTSLVFAWRVIPLIGHEGTLFTSDPRDLDSYGFDLKSLDGDRRLLVGAARLDELGALSNPEAVTPTEADQLTRERRKRHKGKFLVNGDRVVGVSLNGEARAYPLRILNWHEVINDTVGGIPIAVTFSGLCDSVVVFDRRVKEEILELGTSGLLYNSNLVMYDRQTETAARSLWSQLGMRAIAGPAVGRPLTALPMSLSTWESWRAQRPDTTVVVGRDDYLGLYKRSPYGAYLLNPGLKFPVEPLFEAQATGPTPKSKIVALRVGDAWRAHHMTGATEELIVGNARLAISAGSGIEPPTFLASSSNASPIIHSLWFAWYAFHGGEGLITEEQAVLYPTGPGTSLVRPPGSDYAPGLAPPEHPSR